MQFLHAAFLLFAKQTFIFIFVYFMQISDHFCVYQTIFIFRQMMCILFR